MIQKMKICVLWIGLILLAGCSMSGEETLKIQSMEDVMDARIGVKLGSVHDDFATKQMPNAVMVRVDTEPDMYLALQHGKCDVAITDLTSFVYAQQQYPGIKEIPNDFPTDYYGMGFRKDDTKLHAQFNAFLKDIKASGLYQEIYDRWIAHGTESKMPVIDLPTKGEPLRVALTASLYPFAFMKDQDLVGFDVEVVCRFAQIIQRPVQIQNINYGSLIASLQAGKSDIISAGMSITEERKKKVLFSDPYFETRIVVLGKSEETDLTMADKDLWQSLKNSFYSNILAEKRYLLIVEGLKSTVILSLFSLLLGTILGGLICFMRMSKYFWLKKFAIIYISLMRGLPVLVLLMLMFYVFLASLPIDGVSVAIITFAMNFSAYVSEMFRTAILGVDRGQTEAGIALGFTPMQTFYHIVMPQAVKSVLPVYKGEMISLIKMTSVVGYIAVEDLTKMSDIIRSRTFDAFFPLIMVAILYFILAWFFAKALDWLFTTKQPKL